MHRSHWLAAAAACTLGVAALAPAAARAATEAEFTVHTTGDLVDLCDPKGNTPMDVAAVNFCQGFAVGAVTVQMIDDAASRGASKLFCLPSPLPSRNEALAAFVAWARAEPNRLAEAPVDGLFRFMSERFACPK